MRSADWINKRPRTIDAIVTALSVLFLFGGYIVAWDQVKPGSIHIFPSDQIVLDAAWLLLTAFLAALFLLNLRQGRPPNHGLPPGHGATLIACGVFGVAALVETYWQAIFGFGNGTEALLSPPHLVMATAGAVVVSGPPRAAAARGEEWASPATLVSAALLLSALSFVTQFAHPLIDLWAANRARRSAVAPEWMMQNLGAASVLIQATLSVAVTLLLVRGFRLRPGSLALVLGLAAVPVLLLKQTWYLLPAPILAGAAGDIALFTARRRGAAAGAPVGAAIAATFTGVYFADLSLTGGLAWSFQLQAGIVLAAGLLGWLLGRLTLPASPQAVEQVTPESQMGWTRDPQSIVRAQLVKAALETLDNPAELGSSPLAQLPGVSGAPGGAAAGLRAALIEVVGEVASSRSPRDAEAGHLLLDYYVKQVGSHEVVMERLHLSRPTFYRRLQRGLDLVAEGLDDLTGFAAAVSIEK